MRKLKRAIARARMQAEGVQHMNRRLAGTSGKQGRSFFARNWRLYLNR